MRAVARSKDDPRMPVLEQITIAPQLTFDALTSGAPGAPLVLLLHGFAESMNCWRAQAATWAIAPSRRASAAIRPAPGPTQANSRIT
jgi:pimeloyl-ACP methyl ester carboxylesterase